MTTWRAPCIALVVAMSGCITSSERQTRPLLLLSEASSSAQIKPVRSATVSLSQIRRLVDERISSRQELSTLSLGGLTNVTGYRWLPDDLEILGETGGNGTPYSLDLFVESLRLGRHDGLMISLEPNPDTGGKTHFLIAYPKTLLGTQFLQRMVAADYVTKAQILGRGRAPIPGVESVTSRIERRILGCHESSYIADPSASMHFEQEGETIIRVTDDNGNRSAQIDRITLLLKPKSQPKTKEIADFQTEYNLRFEQIASTFAAIEDLRAAYQIFALSQALYMDATSESQYAKKLTYWMLTYPKAPYPYQMDFLGLEPSTVGRICVKDGKEVATALSIGGGVHMAPTVRTLRTASKPVN